QPAKIGAKRKKPIAARDGIKDLIGSEVISRGIGLCKLVGAWRPEPGHRARQSKSKTSATQLCDGLVSHRTRASRSASAGALPARMLASTASKNGPASASRIGDGEASTARAPA